MRYFDGLLDHFTLKTKQIPLLWTENLQIEMLVDTAKVVILANVVINVESVKATLLAIRLKPDSKAPLALMFAALLPITGRLEGVFQHNRQ